MRVRSSDRPPPPRVALTIAEACLALGVSHDTWKLHIEAHVRLVRVGGRKIVPVRELERWCEDNAETVLGDRR